MGVDAGFDMVPPPSKGIADRCNWDKFINVIKERYKDDEQVEIKPNYILFKAGEHPKLPFQGHKLLRFSSKVSGVIAAKTGVASYIDTVTKIAELYFPARVSVWHEGADQRGYYGWREVIESWRSYELQDEFVTEVEGPLRKQERHESKTECSSSQQHDLEIKIENNNAGIDPPRELDTPLFEILDVPGKGRGLVARCDILQGTRILCEKPLFTVRLMPPEKLEQTVTAKLRGLSKTEQRQFLSLHNKYPPGKHPFSGIMRTNALPCGSNSSVGGVYPTACLINHSCLPNAHNNWNEEAQQETIHAIRPIKSGEEITISYDRGGPSSTRRAYLSKAFGFQCECEGCSLPGDELEASDARRLEIEKLNRSDFDFIADAAGNPWAILADCRTRLRLLEEEFRGYPGGYVASVYNDAYQICIAHGDQARASMFAERECNTRLMCDGEDSPQTRKMQALVLRPADHGSFELYSTEWETTRDTIPRDLGAAEFENWLFRGELR